MIPTQKAEIREMSGQKKTAFFKGIGESTLSTNKKKQNGGSLQTKNQEFRGQGSAD